MKFSLKDKLRIKTIRTMHKYGYENWRVIFLARLCDVFNID